MVGDRGRWTPAAVERQGQVGGGGWPPAVRRPAGQGERPAPGGCPLAGGCTGGLDPRRGWARIAGATWRFDVQDG